VDDLQKALEQSPALAVGYASNSLGTINPIKKIIDMAHDAGTWYIDAVQVCSSWVNDVQTLGL